MAEDSSALERLTAGSASSFMEYESGLQLYRTIRVNCDDVVWNNWRMSLNDRYPFIKIGKKQIQPEKLKRTNFWKARAHAAARNTPQVEWGRVVIFYRYPTNHRREVANLQQTSKAIVDGLVAAGVFPDDNDKHVVGPDNRREPVNGPHQVIVRIYTRPNFVTSNGELLRPNAEEL